MFRLMVADFDSPSYFVAIAAVELGFFKQEGIDIELERQRDEFSLCTSKFESRSPQPCSRSRRCVSRYSPASHVVGIPTVKRVSLIEAWSRPQVAVTRRVQMNVPHSAHSMPTWQASP